MWCVFIRDDGWMTAINSCGHEGLVPSNYLQVSLIKISYHLSADCFWVHVYSVICHTVIVLSDCLMDLIDGFHLLGFTFRSDVFVRCSSLGCIVKGMNPHLGNADLTPADTCMSYWQHQVESCIAAGNILPHRWPCICPQTVRVCHHKVSSFFVWDSSYDINRYVFL